MSFLGIETYRQKKDPMRLVLQLLWFVVPLIILVAWAV
jgi:hypothetical protein